MAKAMEVSMLRLFLQELRFRRNAMVVWGLGLCFFPIVYVGLYPSFADQMASFSEIMDLAIYQAMGISMGSFEEYIASTVTNLVPIIVGIYAVINGTGTLAGEEDEGLLELIITLPIHRWKILTVKAIALGISLFVILAIVAGAAGLTLMAIADQIEATSVTPMDMFVSVIASWPLVMALGMISMFLGAFSPSRRIAVGISTAVVLISYLGSNLTGMIESLEAIEWLFVFHFFDASAQAFAQGQQTSDVLVLLGITLGMYACALFFFHKRDLTVGAWPWQKGRLPAHS
jgi:ABC-2 type transport system permease protein